LVVTVVNNVDDGNVLGRKKIIGIVIVPASKHNPMIVVKIITKTLNNFQCLLKDKSFIKIKNIDTNIILFFNGIDSSLFISVWIFID